MTKITKEEVAHVAQLAKLDFEGAALDGFTAQFDKMVEMVESLEAVDTAGVPFTMNVADNLGRMRDDVAVAGWDREALLRSVPESEDGYIKVPAIIDEGEGA